MASYDNYTLVTLQLFREIVAGVINQIDRSIPVKVMTMKEVQSHSLQYILCVAGIFTIYRKVDNV